jgi:hypothetical protein
MGITLSQPFVPSISEQDTAIHTRSPDPELFFGLDPNRIRTVTLEQGETSYDVFDTFTLHIIQSYVKVKNVKNCYYHFTESRGLIFFERFHMNGLSKMVDELKERKRIHDGDIDLINLKCKAIILKGMGLIDTPPMMKSIIDANVIKMREKFLENMGDLCQTVIVIDLNHLPEELNDVVKWIIDNAPTYGVFLILRGESSSTFKTNLTIECGGNPGMFTQPLIILND